MRNWKKDWINSASAILFPSIIASNPIKIITRLDTYSPLYSHYWVLDLITGSQNNTSHIQESKISILIIKLVIQIRVHFQATNHISILWLDVFLPWAILTSSDKSTIEGTVYNAPIMLAVIKQTFYIRKTFPFFTLENVRDFWKFLEILLVGLKTVIETR